MADKKLQKAVEMLESFSYALELIREREKIRKEIDALVITRADMDIDASKFGKKLDLEHEKKKGSLSIELDSLTEQRGNLVGENNRLKEQIQGNKDDIVNYDGTIDTLKKEITDLQRQKSEVSSSLSVLMGKVEKIQTTLKG